MASVELENLLALETATLRANSLKMMTVQGRTMLLDEWSKSEELRALDIVSLPIDLQVPLVHFVVGNPQRGLNGTHKNFYVKPNASWSPPQHFNLEEEAAERMKGCVMLENGTRNNFRQYVPIRKATVVPADKGIQAMSLYGPTAESELDRDRLVEITALEYAKETASPEGRKLSAANKKKLVAIEGRAKRAEEDAAQLRAQLDKIKNGGS